MIPGILCTPLAKRKPLEQLSPKYRARIERGLASGLNYTQATGKRSANWVLASIQRLIQTPEGRRANPTIAQIAKSDNKEAKRLLNQGFIASGKKVDFQNPLTEKASRIIATDNEDGSKPNKKDTNPIRLTDLPDGGRLAILPKRLPDKKNGYIILNMNTGTVYGKYTNLKTANSAYNKVLKADLDNE